MTINFKFLTAGTQPENFQGRESFMELGLLYKRIVKTKRKRGSARKNFKIFTLKYS